MTMPSFRMTSNSAMDPCLPGVRARPSAGQPRPSSSTPGARGKRLADADRTAQVDRHAARRSQLASGGVSAVDVLSVADLEHDDQHSSVVDRIQNAVAADPDSEDVLVSRQLAAPRWAWIAREHLHRPNEPHLVGTR